MWRLVSGSETGGNPLLTTLNDYQGRQIWEYDRKGGTRDERAQVEELRAAYERNRLQQKHSADELLRLQTAHKRKDLKALSSDALPESQVPAEPRVTQSLRGALSFYETLQQDDGHWPGDYGGPMFLMPGMIITCYVTGCMDTVLTLQHKIEMTRYLRNHQNEDGGYGLHIEGRSTMFGTVLSYVSLRLLGVKSTDPVCESARSWIHDRGGATYCTSWGKFWLSVLGVYSWDGQNPLPPEMWLLPYSGWTGIGWAHPGRFWCHCRMVYLPMSYAYGRRGTGPETPLTRALRTEIFTEDYECIDWNAARNQCAKEDLYYPHPLVQDVLWWALYKAEGLLLGSGLRKRALAEVMKHVHYEDENTRYICIGPVNKVLNMLCCWLEDLDSLEFKQHIPRLLDYLWLAEDGMKMQGYNGSQLWDTAFAVQAITATGLAEEYMECLRKAHAYIDASQVRDDCPGPLAKWYRHISAGAWPFSSRDHGWPIADCSSEGLKAVLALKQLGKAAVGKLVPQERLEQCVNVILSYWNPDGGCATYENTRSFPILEMVNPAETFGDIIIDYSYVELTSACMTGLTAFRKAYPDHRAKEIATAMAAGRRFIQKEQRPDGSWYGSWAVCFTYGAWFGCDALAAVGESVENSDAQRRACEFVLSKQRADGGWGESYLSCQDKVYSQLDGETSHVVNTAWAMLALMAAGHHRRDRAPLDAAARCLIRQQLPSGDWPQQHISGVFNRNCMITYANYRNIFPIWALGQYRQLVLRGVEAH